MMRKPPLRRAARAAIVLCLLAAAIAVIPAARHGVLRALGSLLVVGDPIEPGDVVAISETGDAGDFQAAEIEVSDLFQRGMFSRVMLLRPASDEIDDELTRRGVRFEDPVLATLRQLGVPETAIVVLDTGEGGTSDSTRALAGWVQQHPARVLVMIGATHARRYRRALLRVWPASAPAPRVTYPQRTPFHPDGWWRTRRTLRDGLFELEKLAWDYVSHPWPSRPR